MSRFRTTRLFALQVSGHDSTFAPYSETSRWRRFLVFLSLGLAILLLTTPSFRIGRMTEIKPNFPIPDKLTQGSVFTLPADASLWAVRMGGRPLATVDRPRPLLLGAASSATDLELSVTYRTGDKKKNRKSLFSSFQHPLVPFYSTKIRIEADPLQPAGASVPKTSPTASAATPRAAHHATSPSKPLGTSATDAAGAHESASSSISRDLGEIEWSLFSQMDGSATAACWTEPKLSRIDRANIDSDTAANTSANTSGRSRTREALLQRRKMELLAELSVASPGKVVHVGPTARSELSVIISHGGGLFSRYDHLTEARVRKGDQLIEGQTIGTILEPKNRPDPRTSARNIARSGSRGGPRNNGVAEAPVIDWGIQIGTSKVTPESFLALSSQLCDSK